MLHSFVSCALPCVRTLYQKSIANLAASVLALAFTSTAFAFPSQNSDCTSCHDANTNVGQISVDGAIDVAIGDTATVTFSLSDIPTPTDGDSGAIALFGMDAAGLDAIIGTPDNWTFNSGGDNPYVSDGLNNTSTSYQLTFDVGLDAILGAYPIDVLLAGDDAPVSGDTRWLDTTSFSVNVTAVPIPAAVWLFSSGCIGLVWIARKKRATSG
jgi:hypothetical protein